MWGCTFTANLFGFVDRPVVTGGSKVRRDPAAVPDPFISLFGCREGMPKPLLLCS